MQASPSSDVDRRIYQSILLLLHQHPGRSARAIREELASRGTAVSRKMVNRILYHEKPFVCQHLDSGPPAWFVREPTQRVDGVPSPCFTFEVRKVGTFVLRLPSSANVRPLVQAAFALAPPPAAATVPAAHRHHPFVEVLRGTGFDVRVLTADDDEHDHVVVNAGAY